MHTKHGVLNLVLVLAVILSCLAFPLHVSTPAKAVPLAADWTGWPYNLTLIVRNRATTSLPNAYTVQLTSDTASLISQGLIQSDCDDLRVSYLDAGNDVELDRLVEGCNTTSTTVTFRTQAGIAVGGTDANYRLHYGQPAATNPPADARNVYAVYDDFQDGDAAGWIAAKGTWGVVNDGGNFLYRYTGGGANWALAYRSIPDFANLDYVVRIRATNSPFTNWIGAAFRIQDQNNFLTFYQSRDTSQFKYARIVADNHSIVLQPGFSMSAGTWYRMRVQALGSAVRARIWPDGSTEPSTWLISHTDATYQTASNIGATLYNHTTNADWDDFQVRRLVDAEPTVNIFLDVAPWWNAAWGYRSRVTVTNSSTIESLRVNYSTQITVDTAALIATNRLLNTCADLRVVSFDGLSNTELDRVVENCGTDQTKVWFALPRAISPTAQDNGFYLYYGNNGAGAPPANAANVFLFYEDWEHGATHWTGAGGLDPANTGTLGTSVISTLEAVSPSHSQQFPQKRAGGDAFSGFIPISPGTGYVIGTWAKSATGAYAPVGVDPYDAGHVLGSEVWLWTNEWTIGSQWSYRSGRFTTGSNWAYLKIKSEWWSEGPGTAPVYLDNLVLRYAIASEPVTAVSEEETILAVPSITNIHDTGPVEVGNPIVVTADVIPTEGTLTQVTLRITSPEIAEVAMNRTTGDTFSGSFTPQQGGAYTYRIFAQSSLNRSRLSAAQTFIASDTQPPQIGLVSVIDPIQERNTQTLVVNVTDNGRVDRVTLSTGATTYVMTAQGNQYQYAWRIMQAGTITYTVTATDTVGNRASLNGSFTALAREVEVCLWPGCKAGAASWSNDDGNNSCRAELESAGIRGTFYFNGSVTPSWFAEYSSAGHEIGSHSVDHPCDPPACTPNCTPQGLWQIPFTEADVTGYRRDQIDPNVAAIEAGTGKPVISMAWPCGCVDARRMTAAAPYFLSVRGYYDSIAQLTWVEDVNEPTPVEFMNLNSSHSYNQSHIDQAAAEGKWAIVTSHGSCDGISYMGSRQDVLAVAPVGDILRYIKVRDAAQFTNYSRAGRTITFDVAHNLATLSRQRVNGAALLPVVFDNAVTLKAHILDTDTVLSVQVAGSPVSYTVRLLAGARYVVFDTPLNTSRNVVITLAKPAPTIDQVSDNGPIELGAAAHITARVSAEGPVHDVTLHIASPQAAAYSMTLVGGYTDTYEAAFTPSQVLTHTYRISAANDEGTTSQSVQRALAVRDTSAPQWRAQAQAFDVIPAGAANTLSAEALDLGGLRWAILATNETGTWQDFDWSASDWWNHQWPHRRPITLHETAGLARTNETIDVLVTSTEFAGLTNCSADLRVADANRAEVPRQVYDEQNTGGVISCHVLFQASVGAIADRVYYLYYGNSSATAPVYTTDLASSAAGSLWSVRSNFFNLDLDASSGIISRMQLPVGSNTNLPLSTPADYYWGLHQVCSSLDGNITGRNQLCVGGSAPATGLVFSTTLDGPIVKAYELTAVKGTATYHVRYRFLANAPYYQYDLARTGTAANVMNNFWYGNGNFPRLSMGTGGTPSTTYNAYDNGADHLRMASFTVVDVASIDGADNDGTQLGATDYRFPSATGLSLYVTTGASQQAAQDSLARIAAPLTFNLGAVESAPPAQYGSPLELNGPTGWTLTAFNWQNAAIANGTHVQWHIRYCDVSGNCGTTSNRNFYVGTVNPPPLPSRFYGEIHINDPVLHVGDLVQVQIGGVSRVITTAINSQAGTLAYQIDVPGDVSSTLEKDGGVEGDVITFTIDSRVVATGIWRGGVNTRLDFHSTRVNLQPGWNLVSFDLRPVSTAITDVLSSLAGQYDLVYAWDAASQQWLKYDDIPMSGDNLLHLDERQGFWIHLTTSALPLVVYGRVPTSTAISLSMAGSGWNLVGYPAGGAGALPSVLEDHGAGTNFTLVYSYRASDLLDPWKLFDRNVPPFVNDLSELSPGWGYWIQVTAPVTWTVTYTTP